MFEVVKYEWYTFSNIPHTQMHTSQERNLLGKLSIYYIQIYAKISKLHSTFRFTVWN